MKQATSAETFGEVLLAHVPLCYSVARKLTRDTELARKLTLETVALVWEVRDDKNTTIGLKPILLSALRRRYIEVYRSTPATHVAA